MDPAPDRKEELLKRATQALDDGKITRAEYDYFLQRELGIHPKHRELRENVAAIFIVLALIGAVWLIATNPVITGLVTYVLPQPHENLTLAASGDIPLNDTNITGVRISGTLTNGSAKVYLRGTSRLLVYEGDALPRYSVSTDKESYALNETVNVTVQPAGASYTLWLTQPGGERVPVSAILADVPGEHLLDALITDNGSVAKASVTFTVRDDTDPENDVAREQQSGAIAFMDECGQACSILPDSGLQALEVELSDGATLSFSNISIERHSNQAPLARAAIPDLTLDEGSSTALDLGMYFTDPDGDELYYDVSGAESARVNGSTLTVNGTTPGTVQAAVYASDLREIVASNRFSITIIATAQNTALNTTPELNVSENSSTNSSENVSPNTTINETINITENATGTIGNGTNETAIPLNTTQENATNITAAGCSDPDPNKRPLECVQGDVNYFVDQEIMVENLDRTAVGRFTPIGNLLIKGDIVERSAGTPGPRDYTVGYADDLGDYHATLWIDSQTGDLHLRGSLTEANTNIVLPEGWFGLTNRRGILMAMADRQTGDLVIRGSVLPYRRTITE